MRFRQWARVAGCVVLGFLLLAPVTTARADESGGPIIQVEVVGASEPESSPPQSSAPGTGQTTAQPGGTPAPVTTNPTTTVGSVPVVSDPGTTQPGQGAGSSGSSTPGPDEQSISGMLYVSGLIARYSYSANPFGGGLTLRGTVRNVTTQTVDASVRFWVTNVFGGRVGGEVVVPVTGIAPDETREMRVTISGVGQWTPVKAHMTFTPPDRIGAVEMEPMTRELWVFFVPWFVMTGAAVLVGAAVLGRRLRRRSGVAG
ncbi:hypothetical protein GCM10009785_33090 [Brooklawnia cerclae]|uniref:Uncharacterized protein n=1 Tax=Brooklawnia cerclae TaxID=349934 RepID=A0ABX0SBL0_9ACTN|nr:hypothetical protein [Brooklawnia cerclae]NIH55775.1 hypothetical protein [Brooklawnia cerclae]